MRQRGYAWKVTGTDTVEGVCFSGPINASGEAMLALNYGGGQLFRLLDDDGIVYFTGRMATQEGFCEDGFEPLNDVGRPYGCTEIQYLAPDGISWESL